MRFAIAKQIAFTMVHEADVVIVTKKELLMLCLKKSRASNIDVRLHVLMSPRKDKDIGNVFGRGFSWDEALDALADVYNGVGKIHVICLWPISNGINSMFSGRFSLHSEFLCGTFHYGTWEYLATKSL